MSTSGRVVLITGAAAGIGRACATLLAGDGDHVVLTDRDGDQVATVAAHIRESGGSVEHHTLDVTDSGAVDRLIEEIIHEHAHLDGAVNNAGISGARVGVADLDDAAWQEIQRIDLDGVFYCLRSEIRAMRELGGGSIVNMASVLSTVAYPDAAGYVTAKHAVLGLTRSAALDYAKDRIRVNAVGPGFIDTERRRQTMTAEAQVALASLHPSGRLGRPDDVAELVSFLLSDRAENITGSFLPTDGGYTVR